MLGISWGGFNSIQMALRNPPALKAILAVAATEQLFKEDVHYIDGVFHVDEFELTMDLAQAAPRCAGFQLDESVIGPRMESDALVAPLYEAAARQAILACSAAAAREIESAGLSDRRAAGWISRQHPAHAWEVKAPLKAWIGPWNHGFPNGSDRAGGRVAGSSGAMVRLLAQGSRHRNYRGSAPLYLYAAVACSRSSTQECAGKVAWRNWLAPAKRREHNPLLFDKPCSLDWPGQAWRGPASICSERRRGGWILVGRTADRSAAGGRIQPHIRFRAASARGRDSGSSAALLTASSSAPLADWFVRLSDVAPDGTVTQVTGAGINGAQREALPNLLR